MKQLVASWHKVGLPPAFSVAVILLCTPCFVMMYGHGQLDDQQLAKRIRTKLIEEKTAQAHALTEQAANLRTEADLLSSLDDSQVLHNYGHQYSHLAYEGDELFQTSPGAAPSNLNFEADLETVLQGIPNTLMDRNSGAITEAENSKDSSAAEGYLPTDPGLQSKLDEATQRFQTDMDNIEELLNRAQTFHIAEDDSADFETLCRQTYEKSLTEVGLDRDAKQDMLRLAAKTGDFEVQGGLIGNMWNTLPKDNKYKLQSLQAFLRPFEASPHKALHGLKRPCRVLQGLARPT